MLAAATELVEREGYGRLTMEGIARAAGVSKQTLYRWWPTKAAVVLEALNAGAATIAPAPDAGSLEADVRHFVGRSVAGARRNGRLLAGLMAEAQLDPAFAAAFRREFLARRRAVLRSILEDARGRGELPASADVDFVAELVFGMLWYRILARPRALDRRFAERLAAAALATARG